MQTADTVRFSSTEPQPSPLGAGLDGAEIGCGTKVTATALLDRLEQSFHARASEWIFLRELRAGTGHRNNSAQRIDAFALNCLPHLAMKRVAYEVKISRADFISELRQPIKRRLAMRYSNEFYFVTPPGLIDVCEVPVDCGLVEVDEGSTSLTVPAPWRDTPGPSWLLVAAMLRHQRRQFMLRPPPPPKQQRFAFE